MTESWKTRGGQEGETRRWEDFHRVTVSNPHRVMSYEPHLYQSLLSLRFSRRNCTDPHPQAHPEESHSQNLLSGSAPPSITENGGPAPAVEASPPSLSQGPGGDEFSLPRGPSCPDTTRSSGFGDQGSQDHHPR